MRAVALVVSSNCIPMGTKEGCQKRLLSLQWLIFRCNALFFFVPIFYRENEIQIISHYLYAWCQMLFFKEHELLLAYVHQ